MEKYEATPPVPGPPQVPPGWHHPPPRQTNGMAIAALVVGLTSLMSCPLIGAVAIYLGNRARAEIRASGQDGDGLALAGVITGWVAVGIAVATILFFIAYFAIFGAIIGSSVTV